MLKNRGQKQMFCHVSCRNAQLNYKVSWLAYSSIKLLIASYRTTYTLPFWVTISFRSISHLIIVWFPCSREEIVLEKRIWEPHSSYTFFHYICSNGYNWDLSNGNILDSFKILNIHKSGHHGYTYFHEICSNPK